MITVLIADDQTMFGSALASLIGEEPDIEVVATCADGEQALRQITALDPQVALLDIEMPYLNGLDVLDALRSENVTTKVAILTTFRSPGYVRRALESGAAAFITKDQDAEEVAHIIRGICTGKVIVDPDLLLRGATLPVNPLKPRHQEVLQLTLDGFHVEKIAQTLCLSHGTVKNYLSEAIHLLHSTSRVEAAHRARKNGWI